MEHEELSERLRAVADGVSARSDLAGVERGAARIVRRRRFATGVVAAMLVAGAGGVGFGIGRSVDRDSLAGAEAGADAPDGTVSSPSPDGTIPPPGATTVVTTVPAGDDAAGETGGGRKPLVPPGTYQGDGDGAGTDWFEGDGDGAGTGWFGGAPLDVVYARSFVDGLRVRVQRGESWAIDPVPGTSWQPAAYCNGSAELRVTLDGPDLVDVAGATAFDEPYDGVDVQLVSVGWADGRPLRIAVVQTSGGATEVAIEWSDGGTDRTAVVDGVAVLVTDGTAPWDVPYEMTLTGGDGTRVLSPADLDRWNDPDFLTGCQEPPPALPEAGEQPADPAATEAALRSRFDLLWSRDLPREEKPDDLLDDWTGVQDAIDQVDENYGDTARTATHSMDQIVFTSPAEAWFFYTVHTDISDFANRYGRATLVGGVWQFPRALICQDLSLGGGECEPGFEPIYPPSWYERYGEVSEPVPVPGQGD